MSFYDWNPFSWLNWGWGATRLPAVVDAPSDAQAKPSTNEATEAQNNAGGVAGGVPGLGYPGFGKAPPGTYLTYRLMDREPTLSLARVTVWGPILAGTRNFEVRRPADAPARKTPIVGDGVVSDPLDQRAEFLKSSLEPLLPGLIRDCLRSLSLGHYPFEVLWETKGGRWTITRFKGLLPERTQILVDKRGNFVGLRQGSIDLFGPNAFNYANDPEAGNYYGRSRHENCREQWWEKVNSKEQGAKLDKKASGITAIVKGPPYTGKVDGAGKPIDGPLVAKQIADNLSQGNTVYMARTVAPPLKADSLSNLEYIKAYAELLKITAYETDKFDWGNTAAHAAQIIEKCRYIDSELFRGWHRPERSALEGQHGTKAEAGAHGDIAMTDSDRVHEEICAAISAGPINDMLVQNWGEGARDSVFLKAAPLQNPQLDQLRAIGQSLLQNPDISAQVYKNLDKPKLFAALDLDVKEGADPNEEPEPVAPPAPQPPANGNGQPNGKPALKIAMSRVNRWQDSLLTLAASASGHWVTIGGVHVLIGDGGVIAQGPAHLQGKTLSQAAAQGHYVTEIHGKRRPSAPAAPKPIAPKPVAAPPAAAVDDATFGARVNAAARHVAATNPEGASNLRDKVFISYAHAEYEKRYGPTPIDQFKKRLSDLNGQHVILVHEDLMSDEAQGQKMKASVVHTGWSKYHYIRLSRDDGDDELLTMAADDAAGEWRTINGARVLIKDGVVVKGPKNLVGKSHEDLKDKGRKAFGKPKGNWKEPHELPGPNKGALPKVLPFQDPPLPTSNSAVGGKAGGRSATGLTNTQIGDMTENVIARKGGFKSLLPAGQRQNPLDLKWDDGDQGFEVKAVSTDATEYKSAPKSEEVESKLKYAKQYGYKPNLIVAVVDIHNMQIHAYMRPNNVVGSLYKGGRLNRESFQFIGKYKIDKSDLPKSA